MSEYLQGYIVGSVVMLFICWLVTGTRVMRARHEGWMQGFKEADTIAAAAIDRMQNTSIRRIQEIESRAIEMAMGITRHRAGGESSEIA